jgi:hypothetical protein
LGIFTEQFPDVGPGQNTVLPDFEKDISNTRGVFPSPVVGRGLWFVKKLWATPQAKISIGKGDFNSLLFLIL